MTTNEAKLPFADLPREDQDRIAGAIARGESVQWWVMGKWQIYPGGSTDIGIIYRIPPAAKLDLQPLDIPTEPFVIQHTLTPKPAKDPNRPRPAHRLGLKVGDVVMHVSNQDGDYEGEDLITVGDGPWGTKWLDYHIRKGHPKGQRPLFTVVSRAKGGEA